MFSQARLGVLAALILLACCASAFAAASLDLHDLRGRNVIVPARGKPLTLVLFLRVDANGSTTTEARGDVTLLRSAVRQQGGRLASFVVAALVHGATRDDAVNASYDWRLNTTRVVLDTHARLATRWRVGRYPTLILLRSNGRLVKRWTRQISPGVLALAVKSAASATP